MTAIPPLSTPLADAAPSRSRLSVLNRRSLLAGAAWCIPLVLFLSLALPQLALPGLHYDEASEAGVNAMQLVRGLPVDAFRGAALSIGGRSFPLMVQDYVGALNVYLAIPFLALGGANHVDALRLLPVLTSATTLLLTYALAQRLSGRPAAFATALLLAVSPTFVFWSRQGIFVTNITALLAVAAALLARRLARGGGRRTALGLGIVCGLGLWAKLLFLWIIGAGVGVALVSFVARRLLARRSSPESERVRRPFWTDATSVVALLGGAVLGISPLLLFNWQTGGTLATIAANLDRSYYGVNNADFGANLLRRVSQLYALFNSEHLWYLGDVMRNPWAPLLASLSVVAAFFLAGASFARRRALAASAVRSVPGSSLAALGGALLFLAFYTIQSAFTVSDLFITHFAAALPFFFLAVGLAIGVSLRQGGRSGVVVAIVVVGLWAATDLASDLGYHQALARTGGLGTHSDAIYQLAGHLIKHRERPVVALDWGMEAPVRFLTLDAVIPIELFGYERLDAPDSQFPARVIPYLQRPDTLYLFRVPQDTIFQERREAIKQVAATLGLRMQKDKTLRGKDGRSTFLVYRAVPQE